MYDRPDGHHENGSLRGPQAVHHLRPAPAARRVRPLRASSVPTGRPHSRSAGRNGRPSAFPCRWQQIGLCDPCPAGAGAGAGAGSRVARPWTGRAFSPARQHPANPRQTPPPGSVGEIQHCWDTLHSSTCSKAARPGLAATLAPGATPHPRGKPRFPRIGHSSYHIRAPVHEPHQGSNHGVAPVIQRDD